MHRRVIKARQEIKQEKGGGRSPPEHSSGQGLPGEVKFNKPRVIQAAHGKALGKRVPGRGNREGKGAEA